MEALALVFLWPLLALTLGFVFVSAWDINGSSLFPVFIIFIIMVFVMKEKLGANSNVDADAKGMDETRRGIVAFSIALLLPILVKYFLLAYGTNLASIVIGLIFGFGILVWGMFVKNYKVCEVNKITSD